MIERLKRIAKELSVYGEFKDIKVIDEIWHDGGGAPVFLEDVINLLEEEEK